MTASGRFHRILRRLRVFLTGPGSIWILSMIVLALLGFAILAFWLVRRENVQTYILYSGQEGGTYKPLSVEIAKLIERENPRIQVEIRESDGSLANFRHVAKDEAGRTLGIVQNDIRVPDGLIDREADAVRSLLPLHQGVLHVLVGVDSEIQSIPDLRGKVIAEGLRESGSPPIVEALLLHYEIPPGEVDRRHLSLNDACEQFRSGEVDAIVMTMGLKSARFERLVAEAPLRFLGIGDTTDAGSEIEGFRLTYPFVQATTIPKYAYSAPSGDRPGIPDRPIPAIAMREILIANVNLPDLTANRIARTLIESKSSLSRSHPSAAQISEHFDPSQLQFPIHPGAHKYFHRDEPGFLQRNAEVLGFILSLIIAGAGFLLSAQKWLKQLRKNRIDGYYIELDRLTRPLHERRLGQAELETLERKLLEMQHRAIRQLAREKLVADESFRIFQALLLEGRDEVRRQQDRAQ